MKAKLIPRKKVRAIRMPIFTSKMCRAERWMACAKGFPAYTRAILQMDLELAWMIMMIRPERMRSGL